MPTGYTAIFDTVSKTTFTIPNLNKEEKRVPISSVVLSSQRIDLKDAIFDAAKTKESEKEVQVNPLVQEGKKVSPSVTRAFVRDRGMYVYLQAYSPRQADAAPRVQPLLAFVTLYSGDKTALATRPIAVAPNAATRLGVTPFTFSLGLGDLAPGTYDCQISVVDPVTSKAAFWRAPIAVLP